MLNFDDLRLALYNWVSDTTNLKTIWLHPNAPRPNEPYNTIQIKDINLVGWDYESTPDNDGIAILGGDREFLFEINCYAHNALGFLENLRTSLQIPVIRDSLYDNGVVVFNRGDIQDLTYLQDSRFNTRAMIELHCRTTGSVEIDLGFIDNVKIKVKGNNVENDIDVTC